MSTIHIHSFILCIIHNVLNVSTQQQRPRQLLVQRRLPTETQEELGKPGHNDTADLCTPGALAQSKRWSQYHNPHNPDPRVPSPSRLSRSLEVLSTDTEDTGGTNQRGGGGGGGGGGGVRCGEAGRRSGRGKPGTMTSNKRRAQQGCKQCSFFIIKIYEYIY